MAPSREFNPPTSSHGRSGGGLIKPQHRNLISNKNHSCNAKAKPKPILNDYRSAPGRLAGEGIGKNPLLREPWCDVPEARTLPHRREGVELAPPHESEHCTYHMSKPLASVWVIRAV